MTENIQAQREAGDIPEEVQAIIDKLEPKEFEALVTYIQSRLATQDEATQAETTPEMIYASEEFKAIAESFYPEHTEQDLKSLKNLVAKYLQIKSTGNQDLLEESAWHINMFIESNTTLGDKANAYSGLMERLDS